MTDLRPMHGGVFMVNDAAAADPACQMAMASYLNTLKREDEMRSAIRDGKVKPVQSSNWHISDRH